MASQNLSAAQNTRLNILSKVIPNNEIASKVATAFAGNKGNWAATLAELKNDSIPPAELQKVNLAHSFADITSDNEPLVNSFMNLPAINNLRDFALTHDTSAIASLIADDAIPKGTAGIDANTQKKNYAAGIYNKLFAAETSAVLQRMVSQNELPIDAGVRGGVVNFLSNQPDFNIRTTSVYKAVQNEQAFTGIDETQRETVLSNIKTLQRVQAISATPGTVSKLLSAGIGSAHQVADMPRDTFIKAYGAQLGNDEAYTVHYNAVNVKTRNEHALRNFSEAVRGTGVAFIDGNNTQENRMRLFQETAASKGLPLSWENLFGEVDLCECIDCNSVYSPAAYYVELLQYLRNNDLDPANPNSGKKGIAGTVLEKFFSRRPDLGCLELTCENTNTILPYIDLANEVMESFVVHLDKFKVTNTGTELDTTDVIDIWNTEDETTGELLAQPQHTNYDAYCILKNAVYPFTLPYHQPIDEIRIFLQFLGTSRYELQKTFRMTGLVDDSTGTPTPIPPGPNADQLRMLDNNALDRAIDAEFLGMTQEEYIILTKEAFWQKQFFDLKGNVVLTTDQYQKNIGVKAPWEYYGYGSEADMLSTDVVAQTGLTFVKQQFLKRTGLQYTDLVNLLRTKYINPYYPSGKPLTILDSLHFSYRYLQSLVDTSSIDPKTRFATLIAFLEKWQPIVPVIYAMLHPDPCHTNETENCIDNKELEKWVYCYFEKLGKLIVLESGDGPVFPMQGEVYRSYYSDNSVGSVLFGTLNKNGTIVDAGGAIVATIDDQSQVIINGKPTTDYFAIKDGPIAIGYIGKGKVYRYTSNATIGNNAARDGNDNGTQVTWQPPVDTCSIDKVRLQHLDGSSLTSAEYDNMQRFIRLWRKMGWTIDETDKAVTGLGKYAIGNATPGATPSDNSGNLFSAFTDTCDCASDGCDCGCAADDMQGYYFNITPALLHQLVSVKNLLNSTGLELIKLLTFWTNISTLGDPSLYARLFLTHNMVGIDPVFKADDNGNYLTAAGKISDHIPVIMAAFNIKAEDITNIMTLAAITDDLTLTNISTIYRHSLLMRILQVKSYQLQHVEQLFGNPFSDAHTTYHFLDLWGKMEDAGFNYRQLNYIINGTDDASQPLTPKQRSMLLLAKTLYDGLNQIDADNADMTSDDQATHDFVQTKIALLYTSDVTQQIMQLLEGTTLYTTNAPVNLVAKQSDFTGKLTGTLTYKLKYDFVAGSLQVMGILTDAEKTAAKALFPDPNWAAAFDRIAKQPAYFYKDVLAGIFPAVPQGQPDPAQAVLLQGDTNLPPALQDPGNPIPDTAPVKRACFINAFLPFLRNRLEHKFLVDTISDQAGIDKDVTDVLLSEVLMSGTPAAPILETFRSIKKQPPVTSPWKGFLVPAAEDSYQFAITVNTPTLTATFTLNGQNITFHQQDDPNNVWLSDPVKLKTGIAYPIVITGLSADLHELSWKTAITTKTPIPASVLFPDDSTNTVQAAFIKVQKAAILVSGFSLSATEVSYLQQHGTDFDGLNFNAIQLKHFKHLEAYTRLRKSLPHTNTDLISFFTWVNQGTGDAQLSAQIAALTTWNQADIDKLIAPTHFNLTRSDFKNEKNLLKLQQALYVADKISMDIDLLFNWAIPTSKFKVCQNIARHIRITTKARYTETDWEQVAAPLNNQLREDQRNALVSYLLVQPELIKWGVEDADSLFEFFLIDVEMDACMQTSRIKQAINSVQLFVQRCFLGLEEKYGVMNDALDRSRWEWMQREVLWVANRKVFLYPENWIDEKLRDDKSPFYTELESELLQKDINTQNVEDALKNYLYKLDEVADISVVGLFGDNNNDRVHVLGRTRNAPYIFFYRYYDTSELTWSAWEKVQVDIPSYDVEDSNHKILGNGCYLVPVVFNNRLLIFFPQFMKKTVPPANNGTITTGTDNGHTTVPTPGPTYYWEIKMAWSEYRNGKWTPKQVSKDAIYDPSTSGSLPDISKYDFVPILSTTASLPQQVTIDVFSSQTLAGSFLFEGSQVIGQGNTGVALSGTSILPGYFHYQNFGGTRTIQSFQVIDSSSIPSQYAVPYVEETGNGDEEFFYSRQYEFYHPYTHQMLGSTETGNLVDFFECAPNTPQDRISSIPAPVVTDIDSMFGQYTVDGGKIYDELAAPYSLYNWELFFHVPVTLAGSLSSAQSFENAMSWYHYVFNPLAKGTDNIRYWRFWPFQQSNARNYLENLFNSLLPNTPETANGQINQWRNHPFQPHVIARERPSAYMKWVVMKYLDNLISWGDYLFTQHTIESINQATQLYILASHILGERPQVIPKRGNIKPETYNSLLDKWDAFGNAMVEMELVFPYSNQVNLPIEKYDGDSVGFANIYGFATSLYFGIPDNPQLMSYWDTVEDRLSKIRHCENIEGVFGLPPLWDPPIDPALLVQAEAQGISIASVLNDLSTPLPNYRFNYLVQKSLELCGELKSMGNSMLSVFEKKDAEALANLRAKHETTINNLVMEVKKQQLDEAGKSLDSLQQNRVGPVYRLQHYLKLIGQDLSAVPDENTDFTQVADQINPPIDDSGLKLTSYEEEEMAKSASAADSQKSIGVVETLGSILNIIPNFSGNIEPFGIGMSISFGGSNLGAAMQAVARGMQIDTNYTTFQSSNAQRKGGYLRQLQDRVLQANNAGYEIKQIDKQIVSQQIRIQIASQEITNQQKQIDNSTEVQDFLTNKYTNEELYGWMRDNMKSLYYQVYTLAYGLAKKAELAYRYDRGLSNSNFIKFGYWDAGHEGLLAGEQLYVGIKQLEQAYQQDKGYDFEVTKNISLRQVNPIALLQLRATGTCQFELPEVLFDMDFPGHYQRRIRSVALSIPCIVGPYTGINATLRLQSNKFRTSAIAQDKNSYPEKNDQEDDRFMTVNAPITAIAASSGQSDNGVFELNFKDERYMPFEGAGAISTWQLSLPAGFRQFDYATISDVIIQLRYTSKDGGDALRTAATGALLNYLGSVEDLSAQEGLFTLFDVQHDFPNDWYKATQMPLPAGATARTLTLSNLADRLPVFTKGYKTTGVDVVLITTAALQAAKLNLTVNGNDNAFTTGVKMGNYNAFAIHDTELAISNWTLTINDTTTALNDMWIAVRYTLK